jgi:hypothetical protein
MAITTEVRFGDLPTCKSIDELENFLTPTGLIHNFWEIAGIAKLCDSRIDIKKTVLAWWNDKTTEMIEDISTTEALKTKNPAWILMNLLKMAARAYMHRKMLGGKK